MTRNDVQPMPFHAASLYEEILAEVSHTRPHLLPQHVAIIPDGNRRWSKEQARPFFEGYLQGSYNLMKTALTTKALGIPFLTVFTFSTENWSRPEQEKRLLWDLFTTHLKFYQPHLIASNIRLATIGHTATLPQELQETIQQVEEATQACTSMTLLLAMNYGGRDEIVRAVQKLFMQTPQTHISEQMITERLDTYPWPDPDLIIRTGGEQRISNFLLWQSSYAEFYVEQQYWPAFSTKHFMDALLDFQNRSRRHGGGDA